MSGSGQTQHDRLLNAVAERYRRDGYEVQLEPPDGAVPFDLGGYRPDLIARKKDHQALIIAVKSGAERTSFERLRSVVDEVRRHNGWQFVLITEHDVLTDVPDGNEETFSWDEVEFRMNRAQRLSEQGEYEAAYIVLWIAFERVLRFQARQISLPVDRLAPAIVIRQLYSQGELTMSQFEAALTCEAVRNRIVHGFPASDLKTALTRLRSLVRKVVEQWRNPVREI